MPFTDTPTPESLEALPHFPAEKPQEAPERPGALATTAAAMEEFWPTTRLAENVEGSFGPQVSPAAQPGYNPIEDIPARHLEHANEYLHLDNPAQVAAKTEELDHRAANMGIIARGGALGTAVAMAGGFLDPMNVATMALVPEAAPTRIGNAVRWGLANAAVTSGQELVSGALGQDTSMKGSLLNVGGSAVIGGVLGSLARRVPRGTLAKLADAAGTDLHAAPPEQPPALLEPSEVAGPVQRSVLEDAERQVMAETHGMEEAGFKGQIDPTPPEVPRRPPTYVPPKPEPAAKPRPGFTPDIDPQRMSLSEAIAVTKGAESESHGLSIKEAEQQGLDPDELKGLRFGSRRVFTKGGASFDEMAQILHQHGYPVVDEAGNYSPNALLEALDSELRGQRQYSHHADDYLRALLEHERASEAADRLATGEAAPAEAAAPKAEGPLTEPPPDTSFDVEAFEKEMAEEAKASAELHALPGEPAYVNPESASTMGAAAVHGLTREQLTTARGGQAYSKVVGKVAPGARIMRSISTKARQLAMELINIPGTLEMHYQDIKSPDPIERNLWKDIEAMTAKSYSKLKEGYKAYANRVQDEGGQVLKRADFEAKIAMAMRRGDKSDIPEVAKLAQWHRANIFEPWFKRAQAAGMLKGQETHDLWAESYMTRLYDQQKIRANKSGWIDLLRRGFISQGVDPAEATMIAHDVDRRIGGSERGTMDSRVLDGIVPKSGRVKERTLHMPDTVLEPFLSNDMRHLTGSYLRSMVPEVHMTERFGTRDLADQFQGIRDEYAHLMEQARAQNDNARMNELDAGQKADIKTLENVRDILYGNYGVPKDPGSWYVRAGRLLRQVNVSRMLGGATFKHFPDLANTIMRFGAPGTMEVMGKLATSLDAAKLTYAEAKRIGVATDMIMNVTSGALWDTASHSQYPEQRFMRSFNKFFTTITGETPFITGIQSLASKLAEEEILRSAGRVANARDRGVTDLASVLNKNRAAELAASGLDTGMLLRIAQQDKLSGQTVNGLRFGMSERWADQEAARAHESAIERAAHGITMRPGIGDRPFFMNTEAGKFLLQFKSFEFAASRIVGLPMLQGLAHGDMRAAQGLVAQLAMATFGYVAYQKAIGQKVESNPTKLLTELLERTNLMGWLGTAIFPGLHQFGFKDSARWYDKDPVSMLGPSAEMAADLYRSQLPARVSEMFGQAPGQQPLPFRRADMHFIRKMLPYNQVWYMRRALDNAEDWVGNQFNLPGKSLADYREQREREGNPLLQ
jgi:hypothetical protein